MTRGAAQLDRREFLAAAALAPISFQLGGTVIGAEMKQSQSQTRHKIIQWVFDGGLSQEVWDPKPHSPAEVRGELSSIPTTIPGEQFSVVSPQLAARADKLTVVRNVVSPNEFHDKSKAQLLWNNDLFSLSQHGRAVGANIPVGYVEASFAGKGDGLDWEFNKVRSMNNNAHAASDRLELVVQDGRVIMPNEKVDADRLRSRMRLLDTLQNKGVIQGKAVDQANELRSMAEQILLGAFTNTAKLDPRLTEKFGKDQLGQAALVALALTKAGVGTVDLRTGHWDFHQQITRVMKWRFPDADRALAAQIDHLEETGEPIVIAATTELGRSPEINSEGGRDHWARAHSQIFYGGRFPKGKVVSATTSKWDRTDAGTPIADIKHIIGRAAGAELSERERQSTVAIFGA